MRAESPFIDCTDLIGDRDRLLEHGHHNGYFYFPGLLPAEPVLELPSAGATGSRTARTP